MRAESEDVRRDLRVTGLVSFGHMLSHLYMLALPPLFPMVREDLGVDYVDLGLTITAYAITTGLLQTPMGFLVHRFGARSVLVSGLFVNALAVLLVGLATDYWQLILIMFLGGVGSSVFHPADYSILNSRIGVSRLGRSLSAHSLAGNLGFLIAPPLMVAVAAMSNWRTAMISVGAFGVLFSLVMLAFSADINGAERPKRREGDSWTKLVTSPKIMMLFLFYVLSSSANSGMVHFSVVAFKDIYGLPIAVTAMALTAYQALALVAVLPGGWLADRIENHERVLALAFGASGLLVLICGFGVLPFWLVIGLIGVAGGLRGLVNASRDVSVRHAATDVSAGTLFGFVTTGYSGGQIIGPAIYGWLMDLGQPQLVFWASAAFSLMAISTMLIRSMSPVASGAGSS